MNCETKIICTIGPASSSSSILHKMMKAGMDVARLNFSHGNHESHLKIIEQVRKLNNKYGFDVKVLQDLEGCRIRIGHLDTPVEVKKQDVICLSTEQNCQKGNTIPFDYQETLENFPLKSELFIDDGRIRLKITDHSKTHLVLKVLQGGVIQSRKGVNIPDLELKNKSLTPKDQDDINFGISCQVDLVAQSFVTSEDDISLVADKIHESANKECKIIAKIENRSGIKNIDSIIKACDGVMVARGDLGISIPIYKVPIFQKYILHRCNRLKKDVIIATQMLESMVTAPYPTRAEVSDIANAIFDKTDYVMLSGETASGKYPVQAVKMMREIVAFTERHTNILPL